MREEEMGLHTIWEFACATDKRRGVSVFFGETRVLVCTQLYSQAMFEFSAGFFWKAKQKGSYFPAVVDGCSKMEIRPDVSDNL